MSAEATRRERIMRAVLSSRSAAIAGIVFAACASFGLLRLVEAPGLLAAEEEIVAYWTAEGAGDGINWTLQLIFLAAAGFLWFIGVIRSRLVQEPKLFSTVFFGGGVVFVGLLLIGSTAMAAPAVMIEYSDVVPTVEVIVATRALGAVMLVDIGARVAALFIFSTSGLGRQTGALPTWLVALGYLAGLGLLVNAGYRVPLVYVAFPIWVALVSVVLLVRPPEDQDDAAGFEAA